MSAAWKTPILNLFIPTLIILVSGPVEAERPATVPQFDNLLARAASLDRGNTDHNHVALTFDGGWKSEATEPILEALTGKGVRATFFLTGAYIERYPDLVRRIVAQGHEAGNHTYSHPHLTTWNRTRTMRTRRRVDREFVHDQLSRTHTLYHRAADERFAPFWRAPYGEHNAEIRRWAAELGYVHIGWTRGGASRSLDTLDWVGNPGSRLYRSSDEIARRIVEFDRGRPGGANGAIILMHLGSSRSRDYPHEQLGWIIDAMRRKGYKFVTISQMVGERG